MNAPTPCSGSTLGLLFREIRDGMWSRMEHELAATGHALTFSQYITLKTLVAGTAGASDLARAAQLHPGAMTRLLDRLEEMGLIRRVADPNDRRAIRVELTTNGRALWHDISDCGRRVHEQALQGLDAGERERLVSLLERVRDNLTPPSA